MRIGPPAVAHVVGGLSSPAPFGMDATPAGMLKEGGFYGLSTDFGDPHDYLYNMNHSKSLRNHAGITDPQLDQMIDRESVTLEDGERQKAVQEIQRYLAEKMYYQPAAVGPAFIGVQDWVKNYQRNNAYSTGTERRAKLWIDRA